jgi:hypothetical protein
MMNRAAGAAAAERAREETRVVLEHDSHTLESLSRDLKRERQAKVTKTVKIRGAVKAGDLPRGYRIIATSGRIIKTEDGDVAGDSETLIAWDEIAWDVRQRAHRRAQASRRLSG